MKSDNKRRERITELVQLLEKGTQALKKELLYMEKLQQGHITEGDSFADSETVKHQISNTLEQLEENEEQLERLKITDGSVTQEEMVSELEAETVKLLKRMQDKIVQGEILAETGEDIFLGQEKDDDGETAKNDCLDEVEDASQPSKETDSVAERDMEKTVKKLKDADTLKEFKKKLNLKKGDPK